MIELIREYQRLRDLLDDKRDEFIPQLKEKVKAYWKLAHPQEIMSYISDVSVDIKQVHIEVEGMCYGYPFRSTASFPLEFLEDDFNLQDYVKTWGLK